MFVIDPFGQRQFNNPSYVGTQVNFDQKEFERIVNESFSAGTVALVDGYAPFCKHLFLSNFAGVECGYAKITQTNHALIQSCYDARKENELPVLIQYFDRAQVPPPQVITNRFPISLKSYLLFAL